MIPAVRTSFSPPKINIVHTCSGHKDDDSKSAGDCIACSLTWSNQPKSWIEFFFQGRILSFETMDSKIMEIRRDAKFAKRSQGGGEFGSTFLNGRIQQGGDPPGGFRSPYPFRGDLNTRFIKIYFFFGSGLMAHLVGAISQLFPK